MNKNVFVVCAYPYNENRTQVLIECLKSLKRKDFDIALSTNYPITNNEVLSLVDYMIFDKQDIKNWDKYDFNFNSYGWNAVFNNIKIETLFNNAYHYDIYRSMYQAINLMNSMGYEFFYYIEGDCELNDDNMNDMLYMKEDCLSKNKHMIFFKTEMDVNRNDSLNGPHFATVVFGGKPDYFCKNLKLPVDVDEWVKDSDLILNAFELFFYIKFNHLINDFSLYDINIQNKIKRGKLNKTDENGLCNILYFKENRSDITFNSVFNSRQNVNVKCEFYVDDKLSSTLTLGPLQGNYNIYKVSDIINHRIKRIVYLDDKIDSVIEFFLDDEKLKYLKKSNKIIFSGNQI